MIGRITMQKISIDGKGSTFPEIIGPSRAVAAQTLRIHAASTKCTPGERRFRFDHSLQGGTPSGLPALVPRLLLLLARPRARCNGAWIRMRRQCN
jgi:hypothetical protein